MKKILYFALIFFNFAFCVEDSDIDKSRFMYASMRFNNSREQKVFAKYLNDNNVAVFDKPSESQLNIRFLSPQKYNNIIGFVKAAGLNPRRIDIKLYQDRGQRTKEV